MLDEKTESVLNSIELLSKKERMDENYDLIDEKMSIISRKTGLFLNMLVNISKSENIIEVGTSVGYSTLWLAEPLKNNRKKTKIITIEKSLFKVNEALQNFKKAKVQKLIEIKHGTSLEILKELKDLSLKSKQKFDLIFVDADHENIKKQFELFYPILNAKSAVVIDNAQYPEHLSTSIRDFRKFVKKEYDVSTLTIPIGKGVEIILKR